MLDVTSICSAFLISLACSFDTTTEGPEGLDRSKWGLSLTAKNELSMIFSLLSSLGSFACAIRTWNLQVRCKWMLSSPLLLSSLLESRGWAPRLDQDSLQNFSFPGQV